MALKLDTPTEKTPAWREVWAAEVHALLLAGDWSRGEPKGAELSGRIEELATKMSKLPSTCVLQEPAKAIRTWIDGTVPERRGFDALCFAVFGPKADAHPSYLPLKTIWQRARKEPKVSRSVLSLPVLQPPAAPSFERTIAALRWEHQDGWNSRGIAELILSDPVMQNERLAQRLTISVSFGITRLSEGETIFNVGLRTAWLEPTTQNCRLLPDSRPGDTKPHPFIAITGGHYYFTGPKTNGQLLKGNPFRIELPDDSARDGDLYEPRSVPFADLSWNRPGAIALTLTLVSHRTDLDVVPAEEGAPVTRNKQKIIKRILQMTQPKRRDNWIEWSRGTLRGRLRT
jgi:hypothetical protein